MSETWLLIPAAGESRRFRDAGYRKPKAALQIEYKGVVKSMVQHIYESFKGGGRFAGIIIKPGTNFADDVVPGRLVIENSIGQADTVYQIVRNLDVNARVLVMDCDMVLESEDIRQIEEALNLFDVAVAVTRTFDPNASRVDQVPYPRRFAEKEPISEWGIVGLRAFKRAGELKRALRFTLEECKAQNREPYLSMAMNFYNGTKYAHRITEFQDWGTPERIAASGAKIVEEKS